MSMTSENASSADNQQERFQHKTQKVPQKIGYYIAGFIDGEGSFNVSLRKNPSYRLDWQVVLSFNVSQKDIYMLNIIKRYINCGIIKQRKRDGLYSLDVTKPSDVIENVIPFFDKFRLLSPSKRKNYEIFKRISMLMKEKKHLEEKGLHKILKLREELNTGKGRKRKYSINDVFVEKSSETIRRAH